MPEKRRPKQGARVRNDMGYEGEVIQPFGPLDPSLAVIRFDDQQRWPGLTWYGWNNLSLLPKPEETETMSEETKPFDSAFASWSKRTLEELKTLIPEAGTNTVHRLRCIADDLEQAIRLRAESLHHAEARTEGHRIIQCVGHELQQLAAHYAPASIAGLQEVQEQLLAMYVDLAEVIRLYSWANETVGKPKPDWRKDWGMEGHYYTYTLALPDGSRVSACLHRSVFNADSPYPGALMAVMTALRNHEP